MIQRCFKKLSIASAESCSTKSFCLSAHSAPWRKFARPANPRRAAGNKSHRSQNRKSTADVLRYGQNRNAMVFRPAAERARAGAANHGRLAGEIQTIPLQNIRPEIEKRKSFNCLSAFRDQNKMCFPWIGNRSSPPRNRGFVRRFGEDQSMRRRGPECRAPARDHPKNFRQCRSHVVFAVA